MRNFNTENATHLSYKKPIAIAVVTLMMLGMVVPAAIQLVKAELIDEDPFTYTPATCSATVSLGGSTNATVTLGLSGTGVTLTYPVTTTGWNTISGLPSGWTVTPNVTTYSWASGSATVPVNLTVNVPASASPNTYTFTAYLVPGKDSATSPPDGHTVGAGTGIAFTITVPSPPINQPPVADAGGPYIGNEGTAITFDASGSGDADGDTLYYRWDFDSDGVWDTSASTTSTATYTWYDDHTGTAKVGVSDGIVETTDTADVAVLNVDPTVDAIEMTPSTAVVKVGELVSASASFTDPGTLDTHTATWDWGDTLTDDVDLATSPVSGSHAYTAAGVYTIELTVTDDDGGSGTATYEYLVVYDPSAGFVTGGGWITSPLGAYAADPTLTGKATFGFVSKYLKGATVPTGNTEFQFHAAGMNFKSTSYDWLVVAGTKAMYKGVGTINGEGNYGFILSAIDGGAKGTDKFRIQIWDKDNADAIVYDNMLGAAPDYTSDPTTIISGSIVVHK